MTITPELLELSQRVLAEHGDKSAMPDDPGSVAQLTVALRSLLKAAEPEVPNVGQPLTDFDSVQHPIRKDRVPKWQSDPEHFDRVEIHGDDGRVIGAGSQFRGATPSTSAGRYEYDRRREAVSERGVFHVVREQNSRWPSPLEYRATRDEIFREGGGLKAAAQRLQRQFFDTGALPEPVRERHLGTWFDVTLELPADDVKER